MHRDFEGDLLHLDYGREVCAGWRGLRERQGSLAASIRPLLPLSWEAPPAAYRHELQSHLHDVAREPFESLRFFDELQSVWPALFSHLWDLVLTLRDERPQLKLECDPSSLAALAVDCFGHQRWWTVEFGQAARQLIDATSATRSWNYPPYRTFFLRRCLRDLVDPAQVVVHLNRPDCTTLPSSQSLAILIANDRPLQYIYHACATVLS